LDHEETALAFFDLVTRFVDNRRLDSRQGQGARPGLERSGTRQRVYHVSTCLSLPPGIDHWATLATNMREIPHPGFGIDRLAHGTNDAKTGEIEFLGVMFFVRFRRLDQRTNGGRRGIEDRALMPLY